MSRYTVFLFLTLALSYRCTEPRRDIRDYYFPAAELHDGRVYAYTSMEGDTAEQRYWYYRSFQTDSGTYMVGSQYDRYFQVVQLLREKLVDNGALARNSYLYDLDTVSGTSKPITARIESPNLFPFQVSDSLGVFLFQLSYHPLDDSIATIYIIRNRRFLGDGPDFELSGKKYPTVRFGLQEAVGNDREGASEVEGRGEEWYAKGLGLVYYQKSFGEGKIRYQFRLTETFPMSELERRHERSMGN